MLILLKIILRITFFKKVVLCFRPFPFRFSSRQAVSYFVMGRLEKLFYCWLFIFSAPECLSQNPILHHKEPTTHETYLANRFERLSQNTSEVIRKPSIVKVGCLSHIAIPKEIFNKDATFSSDDSRIEIRTSDNQRLTPSSWIKYSREIRMIQVFPLIGNEGVFRFLVLSKKIETGIVHQYFLDVNVTREAHTHLHKVTFQLGMNSFRIFRHLELRIRFVKILVTYFRSLGLFIRRDQIQIIESDSTSGNLVWRLLSVSGCDEIITRDLPSHLIEKNGKPKKNLLAAFSDINSDMNLFINHVSIDLVPSCSFYSAANGGVSEKELTASLIVVIVVVVLVSPVVVALLIRYRAKRKRASHNYTYSSTSHNVPSSIDHCSKGGAVVENHPCQFEAKSTFSCWIFRKKGKSYKMNRKLHEQKINAPSNIFDPKYLQRERSSYPGKSNIKKTPHLSEAYALGYNCSGRKSLSIASSNPSYSTSQETYHSGYSRRPSPTFQGVTCQQRDKRRQLTESMDSSRSSLVRTSSFHRSTSTGRTSVHLINIRPKTVNIQTQHQEHIQRFHEPTSARCTGSSPRNHSPMNPAHSPRNRKKQHSPRHPTVHFSSGLNLDNATRRYSDDSALRVVHHKSTPERKANQFSRSRAFSATCTPNKEIMARRHGSLNHLSTQSTIDSHHPDQRMVRSFDRLNTCRNSSGEILTSLVHQQKQLQHPQLQQHTPQHQQVRIVQQQPQHQLQQHTQQIAAVNNNNNAQQMPERKTSLARRQEFLASHGKRAFELCSSEEGHHPRHVPIYDYEDCV